MNVENVIQGLSSSDYPISGFESMPCNGPDSCGFGSWIWILLILFYSNNQRGNGCCNNSKKSCCDNNGGCTSGAGGYLFLLVILFLCGCGNSCGYDQGFSGIC